MALDPHSELAPRPLGGCGPCLLRCSPRAPSKVLRLAFAVRLFTFIAIVLASMSLPKLQSTALAAGLDSKGKAMLKQATKFFRQGMYEEAAKMLTDLSVDHPDVAILQRHLGACYHHMHRPEPALSNLRAYLAQKKNDITGDDKQEVERWIDEMEKLQAQMVAESSAPRPVADVSTVPSPTQPPPSSPTAQAGGSALVAPAPAVPTPQPVVERPPLVQPSRGTAQEPNPSDSPMPIQKKLGYAAGLAGLAGLGVCIYAYLSAQDGVKQAAKLGCTNKDCIGPGKSEYTSAQNALLVSNITGIVGGVLVAGGLVLVLTTPSPADHNVALVPLVGPGTAGIDLAGRF